MEDLACGVDLVGLGGLRSRHTVEWVSEYCLELAWLGVEIDKTQSIKWYGNAQC